MSNEDKDFYSAIRKSIVLKAKYGGSRSKATTTTTAPAAHIPYICAGQEKQKKVRVKRIRRRKRAPKQGGWSFWTTLLFLMIIVALATTFYYNYHQLEERVPDYLDAFWKDPRVQKVREMWMENHHEKVMQEIFSTIQGTIREHDKSLQAIRSSLEHLWAQAENLRGRTFL